MKFATTLLTALRALELSFVETVWVRGPFAIRVGF